MGKSRFAIEEILSVATALALMCTLCLEATFSGPKQVAVSPAERAPMIISSGRTHGHYYLRVEPNPDNVRDALYLLETKCLTMGHDYPILSFVDSNSNLSDMGNAIGLAGKAQCDNVRTFIVNRENGQMQEIKLSRSEPITKTPKEYSEEK